MDAATLRQRLHDLSRRGMREAAYAVRKRANARLHPPRTWQRRCMNDSAWLSEWEVRQAADTIIAALERSRP